MHPSPLSSVHREVPLPLQQRQGTGPRTSLSEAGPRRHTRRAPETRPRLADPVSSPPM